MRRGNDEGRAPGGRAKGAGVGQTPPGGVELIRMGLDSPAKAGKPEPRRASRDGLRATVDGRFCGEAASSSARALTSTLRFSIMTYSFPSMLSSLLGLPSRCPGGTLELPASDGSDAEPTGGSAARRDGEEVRPTCSGGPSDPAVALEGSFLIALSASPTMYLAAKALGGVWWDALDVAAIWD